MEGAIVELKDGTKLEGRFALEKNGFAYLVNSEGRFLIPPHAIKLIRLR